MNLDQIGDELRPLAVKLNDTPDKELHPDAIFVRGVICMIMGFIENTPPHHRASIALLIGASLFDLMKTLGELYESQDPTLES